MKQAMTHVGDRCGYVGVLYCFRRGPIRARAGFREAFPIHSAPARRESGFRREGRLGPHLGPGLGKPEVGR